MTSKEEATAHLAELDGKVELLKKGSDALERRALEQAQEIKKLTKQLIDITAEKAEAERKLEGFSALEKALSQIRTPGGLTVEQVRQLIKAELAEAGPVVATSPGEGTAELPTLFVKVDRPEVFAEDTSLKGGLAMLIQEGFFDRVRSIGNTATRLKSIGLQNSEKDVTAELVRFCQWRLLEESFTDRRVYKATDGAKERVKLR